MKTLRGPGAYADIIPLLNGALNAGGLRVPCDNTGKAIKLVQRMNQFRILDRQLNEKEKCNRPLPSDEFYRHEEEENRSRRKYLVSYYDNLVIKRVDSTVLIEMRPKTTWGTVTDLNGNPVELEPAPVTWDPIKALREEEQADYIKRHSTPAAPMPVRPVERENDLDPDQPLGLDISDEE